MNNTILLLAELACAPLALNAETGLAQRPAAFTPDVNFEIGKKAPKFSPTSWVQGEPVLGWEKGKVYLIECWATWCGPCIAEIPNLTQFHKKYAGKGLVVIGTNVWDKDATHAAAFVNKQGDKMPYRVAFDDKTEGLVTRDWLVAAGVKGIPHAFIVRDGIVLWDGHPGAISDTQIESMLAGTYDVAKVKKADEEHRRRQEAYAKMIVGNKVPGFTPTKWLQGEPVIAWEKGKVYLIKFSTEERDTRPPGLYDVRILADLHNKYEPRGLVVSEVNIHDNDVKQTTEWLEKQGRKVPYRFAFDAEDGFVTNHWASSTWPQAYAVRDGILIWHGSYLSSLKNADIEAMLAGSFDSATAEKKRKGVEALREKIPMLIALKKHAEALKAVEDLRDLLPENDRGHAEYYLAKLRDSVRTKAESFAALKKSTEARPSDATVQYEAARSVRYGFMEMDGASQFMLDCVKRLMAAEPELADDSEIKELLAESAKAGKSGKFAE